MMKIKMMDSKVMWCHPLTEMFPLFIIYAGKTMIYRYNPTTKYTLTFKQLGAAFLSLS